MGSSGSTRRDFLKQSAMTVASVATAPASVAKLIDPKAILADKNHPAHKYFESLVCVLMNRVNLPSYVAFEFNREFSKAKRGALDYSSVVSNFLGDKPYGKFGKILSKGDAQTCNNPSSDSEVAHKLITGVLQGGFYDQFFYNYFYFQLRYHPKYKEVVEKQDSIKAERADIERRLSGVDLSERRNLENRYNDLFDKLSEVHRGTSYQEFTKEVRERSNHLKQSDCPEAEISKIISGFRRNLLKELGVDGFKEVLGELFSEFSSGKNSRWLVQNNHLKGSLSRAHEESNIFDKVPDEFLSLSQRFKVNVEHEPEFLGDKFIPEAHHRNKINVAKALNEKGLMPDLDSIKDIILDPTGEALGRFVTTAFKNVFTVASEYNQVAKAAFSTINSSIIETNRKEVAEQLKQSSEKLKHSAQYPKQAGKQIAEYITAKSDPANPLVFVINIRPDVLKDGVSKQTYARVVYKMLNDLKIDGLELTKPKNSEGRMFARVAPCSDAFVMLEEVEFKFADSAKRVSYAQARLKLDKVMTENSTNQENEQTAFDAFTTELTQRGSFLKYVNPREEARSIVSDVMNYRGYSYSR